MKKLSLMLALLLVLTSGVLCSCGENSSAKKAAMAAFEAYFEDFDAEAFYEVYLGCNEETLKEFMDEDDFEKIEKSIDNARDNYKDEIKMIEKGFEEVKKEDGKIKISGEIVTCDVYDKDDDRFDYLIERFDYKDTDVEDVVEKAAIVNILAISESKDKDGEKRSDAEIITYYCYEVDGDWFVVDISGL